MADILLVEDKDSLRRVLRLTLENAGYSVTEAIDARDALNQIATARHRLVLTDLRMPNGSGLDVLRSARAADADVPVIVMTAFGSIDEAVQAMKDGAHDFLQKPVEVSAKDVVESLVEAAAHGVVAPQRPAPVAMHPPAAPARNVIDELLGTPTADGKPTARKQM